MDKENKSEKNCCGCFNQDKCRPKVGGGAACGGLWFFGLIASLFYFVPQAVGLTGLFIALIKSVFWPSLIIYKILEVWKF